METKDISLGMFVQEFVKRNTNRPYNQEILTKAVTGINEGTASEGAELVAYDIVKDFLYTAQQGSVLYAKAKKIGSPKYGIKIPYLYEADRLNETTTGIRGYFVGEGEQKTISKAQFDQRSFQLSKLVIRIPASWEILEDVVALEGFLRQFAMERLAWYIDYAILYGSTKIEGIFSANCGGVVQATSADPLTVAVLQNFEKKLAPAVQKNAEWYLSKENWNDIIDLILDASSNKWISWDAGVPYIMGHKVNVMEQLTGVYGIILGDFSQYCVTETQVKNRMSIGFRWDYNEQEILMEVRFSGASFGSVYTLDDGSEVGQFVIANDTPAMESSSSQSDSSESFSISDSTSSGSSGSVSSSSTTGVSESSESSESSTTSSSSSWSMVSDLSNSESTIDSDKSQSSISNSSLTDLAHSGSSASSSSQS